MSDAAYGQIPRIVSLIASATEILHALDLGEAQVGRSHECDWPPAVKSLPQVTGPNFEISGSSLDIDQAVRALSERALSVYDVDQAALAALKPDIIITQDQCAVCAVSLADVEGAVRSLAGSEATIVSLSPNTLNDVFRGIERVAVASGFQERGETVVTVLKRRLERVRQLTGGQPVARLAFIEWIEPMMSCGHWMPELIALAGGETIAGTMGASSPYLDWDELAGSDPDVIFVAPCGFDIARTLEDMAVLEAHPAWPGLRAVANGDVYIGDGNSYFNRPGPRLVESAEILAEVLHPSVCDFGHLGEGYVKYQGGPKGAAPR